MKRILIMLAIIAALHSCEKKTNTSPINKNYIGFSPYTNITKGTAYTGNADFQVVGNSFGVTAFKQGAPPTTPFIGTTTAGEELTYNGATWEYTNVEYWPTELLDFYAYSPYDLSSLSTVLDISADKGLIFNPVIIPANVTDQKDLMYASSIGTSKPSNNNVQINFKHSLSQIHFKARTTTANLKVEIGAIELNNILSRAALEISPIGATLWAHGTDVEKYSIALPVTYMGISYHATDYKDVSSTTNVLMLLPQKRTAWDPINEKTADGTGPKTLTTGSYLKITCKIFTEKGSTKHFLVGSDGYTPSDWANVYVPLTINWKMGYKYTYNLAFGTGYDANGNKISGPISFTTDVSTWTDDSVTPTI